MPKLVTSVPRYRRHATGQAVVTIAGRDFYLGPHNSAASRAEYDRLIGEWIAAGRPTQWTAATDITIVEIAAAYMKYAREYYRKDGVPTGTAENIQDTLRILCRTYGRTKAIEFGPLALKSMQLKFIELDHSRRYVNDGVDRIRRMFRWAASEELVPASVYDALKTVSGLRKGRSAARENPPVTPVADEVVNATLPHLPDVVADMVRFQRLTGCRPAEVCMARPCDIDTTGELWLYIPASHKTEHFGRQRVIVIGPKAQELLRPFLLRAKSDYCFVPAESEKKRLDQRHAARKTELTHGNRPGTNRKRRPKRKAGDKYTTDSYRRAIHRAVNAANRQRVKVAEEKGQSAEEVQLLPKWSPNRLRHSAATEIRRRFGLEAAQVTLGHAEANTTQIYAERDLEAAKRVMREIG